MNRALRLCAIVACLLIIGLMYAPKSTVFAAPKGVFSSKIISLFEAQSGKESYVEVAQIRASPTPTLRVKPRPTKSRYSIVVYGDSMVDTMGEVLEYLEGALKKEYPGIVFDLYNYGQGSQNIVEGYDRFFNEFNYQDRSYPSLLTVKPDILILGSFAYNPLSPPNHGEHKSYLKKLIERGESVAGEVYLLAEIAPLRARFGTGPNGVNWSQDTSYSHSYEIVQQLQNVLSVGDELDIPVLDAYTPSRVVLGAQYEGNPDYVNSSDGIHPSVVGHQFMADLIAEAIILR